MTTSEEIAGWRGGLDALHGRIAASLPAVGSAGAGETVSGGAAGSGRAEKRLAVGRTPGGGGTAGRAAAAQCGGLGCRRGAR